MATSSRTTSCASDPTGARAPCSTGIDHNFGPKNDLIGGDGQYERNVIGPTYLQGIEYSHGWDQALPPRVDTTSTYQLRNNSVIGNWVGFRMDGSYDPNYRSGLNFSSADNGQGINVYDGSFDNRILRNYVAATYDGIQLMAPNATGNVLQGNIIGVAPNGDPAPLTGWGIKLRWQAAHETISGNTIRNAALGGIGLVQNTVFNVRISRNIVSDTTGPAIYLAPTSGSTTKGANNLQAAPVITVRDHRPGERHGRQGLHRGGLPGEPGDRSAGPARPSSWVMPRWPATAPGRWASRA